MQINARAQAAHIRLVGTAEAEMEAARVAVLADLDQPVLLAIVLRDLAGQLPEIGTLNVTPDLLTNALAKLTGKAA